MENAKTQIKQKAVSLGFDLVGITDAEPIDEADIEHLRQWLDNGLHAGMDYMLRNFQKRINPTNLLKNAKSVICVGLNYKPAKPNPGHISNYALYDDYHVFIKQRLFLLAEFIKDEIKNDLKIKVCVDSAPLAERALAVRAGLGFIGKNHMLTNSKFGSQLLLGELITNLPLEADKPLELSCNSCDKCVKACPTGALSKDGFFDARKCISYLTVEHKWPIQLRQQSTIGSALFGCDKCQLACPYNDDAPSCANSDFKFHPKRYEVTLEDILRFTEKDFMENFGNSAIERIGLEKLKTNAKICIKNAGLF